MTGARAETATAYTGTLAMEEPTVDIAQSFPAVPGTRYHRRMWPEPKACKRFRTMRMTARFLAHVQNCPQCRLVIRHVHRESELQLYL
jgi:hypothetical protein